MSATLGEILAEYKQREKRKDVVISFRVNPEVAQMLTHAADKTGLSKTAVLESFIRHGYQLLSEGKQAQEAPQPKRRARA